MAPIIDVPFYDPVVLGNPAYIWIMMIEAIIIFAIVMLGYTEIYQRMEPVWGYRDASQSGKTLAIVRGTSGKMWMEPVENVAGIFQAIGAPLKWILTAPVSGQFGKVNAIDVSDDWNIVHNVDIDYAILIAIRAHNADIESKYPLEITEEYLKVDPLDPQEGDQQAETRESRRLFNYKMQQENLIYDYPTFEKHIMNGDLQHRFPNDIVLPPLRIISFKEIQRYLPKWKASHMAGYLNEMVARRAKPEDVESAKKAAMWLAAGGIIFLTCCALGYILITSAHPQAAVTAIQQSLPVIPTVTIPP